MYGLFGEAEIEMKKGGRRRAGLMGFGEGKK